MWKWEKRRRFGHAQLGAWLLVVSLVAMSSCGRRESEPPEPELPAVPDLSMPEARPAPPAADDAAPVPPIPPLAEAERPTESPLNTLPAPDLTPTVEPPQLGRLSLEEEIGEPDASEAQAEKSIDAQPESPLAGSSDTEPEPALDLPNLTQRLRETEALGVFTKVALKNQIDDLLDELQRFHRKGGPVERLRERYDGLVVKIMALVQEDEPRLASDIARSREFIWAILADPHGFAELAREGTS